MKKMMKMVLVAVVVAAAARGLAAVRVDTRAAKLAALLATGVERVGTSNGGAPIEWDTTQVEDGWMTLTSGGGSAGTP